jgi:hypothetical protein
MKGKFLLSKRKSYFFMKPKYLVHFNVASEEESS